MERLGEREREELKQKIDDYIQQEVDKKIITAECWEVRSIGEPKRNENNEWVFPVKWAQTYEPPMAIIKCVETMKNTPFRSFRPLIEKNRRGTYYKVWRRWNNVVFNIEGKLLKETKKAMSENIAHNILVPLTCFAETFDVFKRNVRRAPRAFTRCVEQLRYDYPEIKKYIYRIEHNILILNQLLDEIQNE